MTDDAESGSYRSADEQDVQIRVDGEEYGLSELVSVFERLPGFARDFLSDDSESEYDVRIEDVQVEIDGEAVQAGSLDGLIPQAVYEQVEEELDAYEEEIDEYQEALDERLDELEELRQEYRELEEKAKGRTERLDRAYDRIERKEVEISALQRNISEKQEEISEIEEEYIEMKDKFLRQRDIAEGMKEDLAKAQDRIRDLESRARRKKREEDADSGEGADISEYRLDKTEVEGSRYEDLGGIDEQIERLRRPILLHEEYPGAMQNIEESPSGDKLSARLLVGAPGTGKTASAKAVANEVDMPVYLVNGPEIIDGIVGQAEGNVEGLFDDAREAAKENGSAMLIFDEIDSISRERGDFNTTGVNDRVVNQLLSEMSGVLDNENLYVLATTNRPDVIDPALKRPGRFGDIILYPRPDREGTEEIASIYFPDEMVEDVTDLIAQYDDLDDPKVNSGDNIREVANEAKLQFLMEDKSRDGELVQQVVEEEMERVRRGEHEAALAQLGDGAIRHLEANDFRLDDLTGEEVQAHVQQHLFETRDHLRYVPDEIIEDAVEEVYSQVSEDDRKWNELEDGEIRSILNPDVEEKEEVAAAGA